MLWILIALAALAAIYWFMVRPVLAQWDAFKPFYATLNDVEATWWFRVRMSVKGLKVQLVNAAVIIATSTLSMLQMLDAANISAFLPNIRVGGSDIPAAVYLPVASTILTGAANIVLRKYATTTPAGSPVPETPAVVEVPTVPGKPDAVVETVGTEVTAVAPKDPS